MRFSMPIPSERALEGATVACMATFPPRHAGLAPVLASLAPQVDRLFVYANGGRAGLPDLAPWPNVLVLDAAAHAGDLSANGKIFPLRFLRDCLVFTVDDDFLYPPDYVARYRAVFAAFGNRCCVTCHGGIFPPQVRWYYERHQSFLGFEALEATQLVSLAGSGTFAFHQATLALDPQTFRGEVMVDLRLSLAARAQGLPIWSLRRADGWLRPLGGSGLYHAYLQRITHHTIEARRHEWSFATYRDLARAPVADYARARAAGRVPDVGLDPELVRGIETGEIPALWRRSRASFGRRARHLALLNRDADAAAA